MNKTSMLLAAAAAFALSGAAKATELKQISDSIFAVDGLPADAYTSASIVGYGEPPKKKVEEKRRFAVGYVPTVPPAPGAAEKAMANAPDMAPEGGGEAMKADAGMAAPDGVAKNEKTSAVPGGTVVDVGGGEEIDTDGMKLRLVK